MIWQRVFEVGQSDGRFRALVRLAYSGRIWRQASLLLLMLFGITTSASWWRGHPADAVRPAVHPDASQMALVASYRAFPKFPGVLTP